MSIESEMSLFSDLPQVLQKAQMGKMMIWGVELKVDNLYVWRWISRDKEHTMAADVLECYSCYKGQEAFEASLININKVSKKLQSKYSKLGEISLFVWKVWLLKACS